MQAKNKRDKHTLSCRIQPCDASGGAWLEPLQACCLLQ